MNIRKLAIVAIMLFGAGNALAATLSVPLEYPTIQAAIDAAAAGDEVFIANGIYREPITLKSDIALRGESTDGVVLFNPGPQYGIYAENVSGTTVSNVTLKNDLDTWTMGAYLQYSIVNFNDVVVRGFDNGLFYRGQVYNSTQRTTYPILAPEITDSLFDNNGTAISFRNGVDGIVAGNTITNNSGSGIRLDGFCYSTISNNTITGNGNGVYIYKDNKPLVENNIITGNTNGISSAWRSSGTIRQNIITDNTHNGFQGFSYSWPVIQNNLIANNGNDGIWAFLTFSQLINNTIVGNGANGIFVEWYAFPTLRNNVIAFNDDWGVYNSFHKTDPRYHGRARLYYTTVFGNAAGETAPGLYLDEGVLFTDPLLRDVANGNFELSAGSPAIDAGDPNIIYSDLDGSRNDMGAYGGPYALPSEELTPEEMVEAIQSTIIVLPDDAFKNEAEGRKEELELKLDEVLLLIEQGDAETDPLLQEELYRDALNKLKNDLLKKADGHFGGKLSNDWITTYEAQSVLYPILVDLINEVEALLAL